MLKLQNLTAEYPDKTKAIDGVSITVNKGEIVALIGGNGAGKTSLFLALTGILEKSDGLIEIDGIELNKKTINEIRKRAGMVFQNPDDQLFLPFIYDDIAFGCRNLGLPEEIIKTRVDKILTELGINHLRGRSSLKLSGGEKRMAAIATVLAMEPSLLIFDEPTAFLDPRARRSLIETLKKLPHTKIIATHDLRFASEVCCRVVILKGGKIAAEGGLSLLYNSELMINSGLEAI